MPKETKLKLKDLKVNSFETHVKGGARQSTETSITIQTHCKNNCIPTLNHLCEL